MEKLKRNSRPNALNLDKRKDMQMLFLKGYAVAEVAQCLGVTRATIYEEFKRNEMTIQTYNPDAAQERANKLDKRLNKKGKIQ